MNQSHDVLDNAGNGNQGISLSASAISFLEETRRWTHFLSILGFIGIGIIVVFGLFAGAIMTTMSNTLGAPVDAFPGFMGFFYILMAALYFFPVLYLYRFGAKLKVALSSNDNTALTSAFENLKSHYKYIGIFTIVMIAIYLVGFLFMIFAGVTAMNF